MQDFVSTRWIRVVGWVAAMSVLWTIFLPYDFPWMGLLWVTLGVSLVSSAVLWLRVRAPRSITQMIDDVEAEPVPAAAVVSLPKAVP